MKALVIRQPWVDLILSGEKTWELRGSATSFRGRFAVIQSGTGTVVGICQLVAVVGPLAAGDLAESTAKHRVPCRPRYRRPHAWVLEGAERLRRPVPYRHPSGAVIWVNLSPEEAAAVERALAEA